MAFEIIKDTKLNGDVFFSVKENGSFLNGSIIYKGEKTEEECINEAKKMIANKKASITDKRETVYTED